MAFITSSSLSLWQILWVFVLCANSSWGIAPQVAPPWCLLTAAVPDRIGTGGISLRIISQDLVWPFVCCDWICIFFSCCFIWFSLLFHTFTFNQLNYFDFWLEFRKYCGLGWNKPPSSVTRLIESDSSISLVLQLSHMLHCQKTPCFTRWGANVTDLQGNGATESPR